MSLPTKEDPDAQWASGFLRDTLHQWRLASVRPNDLFYPFLDRRWQPMPAHSLTLVSQCRLIYNFCRAFEAFGDAEFAEAARHGLHGLQDFFGLTPGLYRWAVHPDGTEANPTPDAYGHAFCLLAQATAARVLNDTQQAAQTWQTWDTVAATFTDTHGGLIWHLDGPKAAQKNPRSQNPLMHMFEALLALGAMDNTGRAHTAAENTLQFLQTLSDFHAGMLVERYTPDWQPLPVEAGGVIDLGHAFEWAWLLSEWHEITHDPAILTLGERFLRTGLAFGLDTDGGVFESCNPDGQIVRRTKGLWQQCEVVRALRRYTARHGRTDLDASFQRALLFYQTHFVDLEYGGVYASLDEASEQPRDTHKGDAWKLDYHTTGMCWEIIHSR